MKKIALHWQILFALTVSVLYGIVFSTSYILSTDSENILNQYEIPESIIIQLNDLNNKSFNSQSSFEEEIYLSLGEDDFSKYRKDILNAAYHNPAIKAVSWMGDIFLRALKMLVIPLIICSIVTGIANIGKDNDLGRLGFKTILYYITTSIIAIVIGLVLVSIIKPGLGVSKPLYGVEIINTGRMTIGQILINIVPVNIFEALTYNYLLSIIFFSILLGIFITKVETKYSNLFKDFFNASFAIFMKITMFVIKLAPLGVFGLVAKVAADQENFGELIIKLGKLSATVIGALIIHSFIIMPLLLYFIGKSNPVKHFKNMSSALLTAFSTTSSAATLPLTIKAVEEESGVSKKITNFTLPIGATVNMDGTAIYICVVVIFIAQVYGMEIGFKEQIFILITALLTSIGTAAIPMGSLILITIILATLGLPLEGIALILPVDRILDMCRTSTNVWSDSCGAVIIAKSEGETLKI